jgi:hypothetical protein
MRYTRTYFACQHALMELICKLCAISVLFWHLHAIKQCCCTA